MSVPEERLSDILSGKEPTEVVAPEPTGDKEAAPPAAESKTDDKAAKTEVEPKAVEPKVEPKVDEPAKPRADVAAIIDERRKRQAAEARVRELEGKPAATKPSVFEDEDAAIRSRVDEATRPLREAHYNLSMRYARQGHADFADAEQAFMDAAEANPALYESLRNAPDPGEYVYIHGIFHKEMSDVGGDLGRYREKVTGESRTQIAERDTRIKALEAQVAELTKHNADLETLPRSLNSKPSGAAPQAGSEDEEDIKTITRFGNQKR